jgi:hypothetical protein
MDEGDGDYSRNSVDNSFGEVLEPSQWMGNNCIVGTCLHTGDMENEGLNFTGK